MVIHNKEYRMYRRSENVTEETYSNNHNHKTYLHTELWERENLMISRYANYIHYIILHYIYSFGHQQQKKIQKKQRHMFPFVSSKKL